MKIDSNKLLNTKNDNIKNTNSEVKDIIKYVEILLIISKTLIEYRKKYNLTQEELADKLGLKKSLIFKLEGGDYNPTFKMIYEISTKLTDSSDLFCKILKDIVENIEDNTDD